MLILNRHDDLYGPRPLAINPHHVSAVEPLDDETCRVYLATGKEFTLAHPFVELLQNIADAFPFDDDSELEPDP